MEELLECVHKLHGATRYCGVPELRAAANHLETAIKCSAPDLEHQKDQLLSAMERLQIWSDQTDWQQLFRERHEAAETT
jgi:two-component system sensor histidine kinase BarA